MTKQYNFKKQDQKKKNKSSDRGVRIKAPNPKGN